MSKSSILVTSSGLTASGVMVNSEAFWIAIIEPSGSALATSAAASAPLAPSRLITGKDAPELVAETLGHGAADQVAGPAGGGADIHLDRAGGPGVAATAAGAGLDTSAAGGQGEAGGGGGHEAGA